MTESSMFKTMYANATNNDFVMVEDPDGHITLDNQRVQELAAIHDTDGVIRAVRTKAMADAESLGTTANSLPEWFMDYRNADGSIAQMCGNGVRAYAAYLRLHDHVTTDSFDVMTRAGVRHVDILEEGPSWSVRVGMGPAQIEGKRRKVKVGHTWLDATDVSVGNPHTVVQLPSDIPLSSLDLTTKPALDPEPAEGTNIEFVERLGERHVAMRVFERGVGETQSCGTGATAVIAATAALDEDHSKLPWRVDVLGGELSIGWDASGEMTLSGPAELG